MLTETFVVFQRQMRILLRNPVWVFFGLTQPILYLVLFGPLLKKVVRRRARRRRRPGRSSCPGLLLQLAIFGAGFAGFGIIQELREGVIDRQRVTPARRVSLILGRTLGNVVTIGVQGAVLVAGGAAVRAARVLRRRRRLARAGLPARARHLRGVVRDGPDPEGRGRVRAVHPGRLAAAAAALRRAAADDAGAGLARARLPGQPAHPRRRREPRSCSAATSATVTSPGVPGSRSLLAALLAWWGTRMFQRQSA